MNATMARNTHNICGVSSSRYKTSLDRAEARKKCILLCLFCGGACRVYGCHHRLFVNCVFDHHFFAVRTVDVINPLQLPLTESKRSKPTSVCKAHINSLDKYSLYVKFLTKEPLWRIREISNCRSALPTSTFPSLNGLSGHWTSSKKNDCRRQKQKQLHGTGSIEIGCNNNNFSSAWLQTWETGIIASFDVFCPCSSRSRPVNLADGFSSRRAAHPR